MVTLSKKTEYALIALTYLTAEPKNTHSARALAQRSKMPPALLMNVLKQLSGAGLVESVRGAAGGYRLGRPADEITLTEVIAAVDGPVHLTACAGTAGEEREHARQGCRLGGGCPVHGALEGIHERLVAFLSSITLEQIAADELAKSAGRN